MEKKYIGIRALDVQTGLYKYTDPILDMKIGETMIIGKAASLASHLRGIQVVEDYEALKALSSKLGINSTELVSVLEILEEIEYIRIIGNKRKPKKIEVLITFFEETYERLGEKWIEDRPDEFEKKVIQIINELASNSYTEKNIKDKYDLDKEELEIISYIGRNGGFIDNYKCDGANYIFSPIYMEENPKKVIDFLNDNDEEKVKKTMELLRSKPGYPVCNLNNIEDDILLGLMSKNILPTPAITASGGKVNFLFTPFSDTTDKEMVRQARNVVAAVRYGEKFSQYSELRDPAYFLQCLLDRGYIGRTPHSDIEAQYGVLRDNALGRIEEIEPRRYRFYLADTEYARDIIRLAKTMITSNKTFNPSMQRGIIKEAWEEREYLSGYKFSEYIPNLGNIKNINNAMKEKASLPKMELAQKKVNEALNKLLINGGEPDVF